MAVLIDTSVLIDAERRGQSLERAVGEEARAISAITVSELLHGVHRATDEPIRVRRAAFVEHLLASIEALPVTTEVARAHASVWARLEEKGTPIGAHDLWIGATALAHGMSVATANAGEFRRIPGLVVAPV
ncbi:MAG TPA: PIN domain-containing protein [Solirubrobacterales bacterium]|jgi:tRNA(fMet)-specific endonuclease VapC|nr:PIN domain-containing protein [Solirubrobacterales bacterium]